VQGVNPPRDLVRLLPLVPGDEEVERLALGPVRPEALGHPAWILGDDRVGRGEDVPVAPVVLLQLHHPGAPVEVGEAEDVAHLGPAPAVDGLVVVADHDQIGLRRWGDLLQQLVLDGVGVLELVHQHVLEPRPVPGQRLGVLAEQLDQEQEQVAEVHRVRRTEQLLVGAVGPLHGEAAVVVRGDAFHVGPPAGVLLHVDAPEHVPRVENRVHPLFAHRPLHQLELVRVVVDDEGAGEPDLLRLAPEDGRRRGVEGGHVQVGGPRSKQRLEPLAHLPGGLVGEGDRQDAPGGHAAGEDQVGHPAGDDPRLPRAGAGEDQERSVAVEHGLTLGRVEVLEELSGRLERRRP
jgi:hypothetical protein